MILAEDKVSSSLQLLLMIVYFIELSHPKSLLIFYSKDQLSRNGVL